MLFGYFGAHSLGLAQCFTFKSRLIDFKGTGLPDPTLDTYWIFRQPVGRDRKHTVNSPQSIPPDPTDSIMHFTPISCPTPVFLDIITLWWPISPLRRWSVPTVNPPSFLAAILANQWSNSGYIGIVTHPNGQIRKNCRLINQSKKLSPNTLTWAEIPEAYEAPTTLFQIKMFDQINYHPFRNNIRVFK